MGKCEECHKTKPDVDYYQYPGGEIAQLCRQCANDCGFPELRDSDIDDEE